MMPLSDFVLDLLVSRVHSQYKSTAFRPSSEYQFTVLAAFVLVRSIDGVDSHLKVISLATGSKCLPKSRLPPSGDALHDSHAEVLARRGVIRWLYEEVQRSHAGGLTASEWIEHRQETGKYGLKDTVELHMYISTIPCGDASTRLLAFTQSPSIAALKDSSPLAPLPPHTTARGRDNYSLLGVLRTKPGRADAPPTISMSCSDKIASWSVLGVQGALASVMMEPAYVSGLVLGMGDVPEEEVVRRAVKEDCERAVWGRLEGFKAPPGYRTTKPAIYFTSKPFVHSRASLQARFPDQIISNSSNESLCWFADSHFGSEVIINGVRRGVGAAKRGLEKYRPRLCKQSLFNIHSTALETVTGTCFPHSSSYHDVKRAVVCYGKARSAVKGDGGPFSGWVVSGKEWESFTLDGNVVLESATSPKDQTDNSASCCVSIAHSDL